MTLHSLLSEGTPLSESQFNQFKKDIPLHKDEYISQIGKDPKNFLKSIQNFNSVSIVATLTNKDLAHKIITICVSKFDGEEIDFYLSLYTLLLQKYDILHLESIGEILSLFSKKPNSHSLIILAIILQSKTHPIETSEFLSKEISKLLSDPNQIINAFSALEAFIPVFPLKLIPIYTSKTCKDIILGKVTQSSELKYDQNLILLLLKVVSLSCIDENARKVNTETFLPFLIAGCDFNSNLDIQSLSVLCIVKLWSFSKIENVISLNKIMHLTRELMKNPKLEENPRKYALEALAYLSLNNSIKSSLRDDEILINELVHVIKTHQDSPNIYGALLVLGNLSQVKEPGVSKERKTVNYLKSVSVPNNDQPSDDDGNLEKFCHDLVEKMDIVAIMRKLDLGNPTVARECIVLLYNVAFWPDRGLIRKIVLQGGLALVLKYLTTYSSMNKQSLRPQAMGTSPEELEKRLKALRSLSFMCRSVDPKLAFNEYDVKTAVPFLGELLGTGPIFGAQEQKTPQLALVDLLTPLDKFWCLLALTNLCARPDKSLNVLIINRFFDLHIKDLMIESGSPDIQRATWELINNLILEPLMLAKFFNADNSESLHHLDILVKMLHSLDEKLQVVIAGILANATMEYDLVTTVILSQNDILNRVVKISSDILQKQPHLDDLILRLGTFLGNLFDTAQASTPEKFQRLRTDSGLLFGFKTVLQTSNNSSVFELISEIVSLVTDP